MLPLHPVVDEPTLDGFTIEQWRDKYRIADRDRMEEARVAGERLRALWDWDATVTRICQECGISWPLGMSFSDTVIAAFKRLQEQVNAQAGGKEQEQEA